ncbi:hypothetical protein ACIGXM_25815 [Kitasatospora sp. NPDC052896]|uniref:hypothetical protein n=1 Tax=Kitasatospora sp. NPDC052896 TaxID=3364061 RepID=UPI0037C79546
MADLPGPISTTGPVDLVPLDEAVALIRAVRIEEALAALAPGITPGQRTGLTDHCELAHTAVLLSAPSERELRAAIRSRGLTVGPCRPSTVARHRLADRYGADPEELDVSILSAPVPGPGGQRREVEIFALIVPEGSPSRRVAGPETAERNEEHLALRVLRPDHVVLGKLRAQLTGPGRMHSDGGGYNAHEDGTVLYFRTGSVGGSPLCRRLELYAPGHHPHVLAAHLDARDPRPLDDFPLQAGRPGPGGTPTARAEET